MDVKLESLIEKIKRDGITEAKKISEGIIQKARKDEEGIIKNAKEQADEIIEEAKFEAQKLMRNAESSLKQAARDLVLVLKEKLISLFDRIFKYEISKELRPEFMKNLILKIVNNWPLKEGDVVEVLVNKEDEKKLEELLLTQTNKEVRKNNIEIKIGRNVEKGFRVGIKEEEVYYDFTDEGVLDALKEFLNFNILNILDKSNG